MDTGNERCSSFELLKKHEAEILSKENYYIEKLKGKTKEIDRQAEEAMKTGILPWIFERVYPKVKNLRVTIFAAILKIVRGSPRFMCFHFIEDENPRRIWMLQEMDFGKGQVRVFKFLLTEHYLERFEERNKSFIGYTGNLKEAIVLDLLGGASLYRSGLTTELLGQFIFPSEIMNLELPERMKLWEGLKELAKTGDTELAKYLNLNESVSITKTIDGYGIYKMEEDQVTMITWMSRSMITGKQEKLFDTITQKILEVNRRSL